MTIDKVQDYVFTFPWNHKYRDNYVVIRGTFSNAALKMYARNGQKWSFQYSSKEQAGVEQFGLTEVRPKILYIK